MPVDESIEVFLAGFYLGTRRTQLAVVPDFPENLIAFGSVLDFSRGGADLAFFAHQTLSLLGTNPISIGSTDCRLPQCRNASLYIQ